MANEVLLELLNHTLDQILDNEDNLNEEKAGVQLAPDGTVLDPEGIEYIYALYGNEQRRHVTRAKNLIAELRMGGVKVKIPYRIQNYFRHVM